MLGGADLHGSLGSGDDLGGRESVAGGGTDLGESLGIGDDLGGRESSAGGVVVLPTPKAV